MGEPNTKQTGAGRLTIANMAVLYGAALAIAQGERGEKRSLLILTDLGAMKKGIPAAWVAKALDKALHNH